MIRYYPDLIQGTPEWFAVRLGKITASEMRLLMTAGTQKAANNEKSRAHLYELAAQRVGQYVEPSYVGDKMARGYEDEIAARLEYGARYAPVTEMGFVTNDRWGFEIGYSPDGLVGNDGLIECKSRDQHFQFQTILDYLPVSEIMPDFVLQAQTGLMVTERQWMDHLSYCGGWPMTKVRVWPDPVLQAAIQAAASEAEVKIQQMVARYGEVAAQWAACLTPTERRLEMEII